MDDDPTVASTRSASERELPISLDSPALVARLGALVRRLFGPEPAPASGRPTHLWARWLFLRALGLLFFSAFYSLAFQIRGLVGPHGILPATEYLHAVAEKIPGLARLWDVPTLLWIGAGDGALRALWIGGMIASLLLVFNLWPRVALIACLLAFLSFVAAARAFASYQSDGMLLEAGFLSLFFAPSGLRPGLGLASRPSPASRFLLVWEWFRIYFESGVVKLKSGDPEWRHLTALDHYYQNGPLPTWLGYWVHHLPHPVHAVTAALVLVIELLFVWTAFLPRRFKILCFLVVTPMQAVIILTANYAFLNYLVLVLGLLLLDDRALARARLRTPVTTPDALAPDPAPGRFRLALPAAVLSWIFLVTVVISPLSPIQELPAGVLRAALALDQLRIANRYGLFAVMTEPRYEIELQGSRDGVAWVAYPFRYKPQDLAEAPGLYAPYQPRFEWNLWFASLGRWQQDGWVLTTEERLLEGDEAVLGLFRRDPFDGLPPRYVRAVLSLYSFTDLATERATGRYWDRTDLGLYAPELERRADGRPRIVAWPDADEDAGAPGGP